MKKILFFVLIITLAVMFFGCEKNETEQDNTTGDAGYSSELNNSGEENKITSQQNKDDSVKIEKNKVEAPGYNLDIPKGFEVKSSDDDLLLENKKGTIQFNIMDKTEVAEDYDQYIQKTYDASKSAGITVGEIEDVTISGIAMKRFSMNLTQDDEELESYIYFAQTGGRVLMITLTSKDGGLEDVNAADEYVAQIDF